MIVIDDSDKGENDAPQGTIVEEEQGVEGDVAHLGPIGIDRSRTGSSWLPH